MFSSRLIKHSLLTVAVGASWIGQRVRESGLYGLRHCRICLESVKMPGSADPAQIPYDLGLTYVASGNKQAARARYEELKRLKSSLAEDLLTQIKRNEVSQEKISSHQ